MTSSFDHEFAFTAVYRDSMGLSVPEREARCMAVLYPALFQDIQPGDLFAGRLVYPAVGFGLELASGGPGYYCHADQLRVRLDGCGADDALRAQVEEMIAFWEKEATISGRLYALLTPRQIRDTENPIAEMGGRLSGACLDFGVLVRRGLNGMMESVDTAREQAAAAGRDTAIYRGMRSALELLSACCLDYARRAHEAALDEARHADEKAELRRIAAILEKIAVEKPETFREAVQLYWMYALISGVVNYGRMDIAVGSMFCRDIDQGWMSEEEGLALVQSLWRLMAVRKIVFNGRVVIGGMGRPNEADADRFAMVAMEATRTVHEIEPQLTLRHYSGQNPELMRKALDVLGEGRTFPMLYNDEINVPAVMHAFNVSREEAEHYFPYGCGEYALEGISFGSPNCSLNLLKCVEIAMRGGVDALTGADLGLKTGRLSEHATFDSFLAAYKRQVEFYVERLAERHAVEYQAERESAAFLFISMLLEGCIEHGLSVVEHGTRYLGGVVETFGIVNAGDSLAAIERLVYTERVCSAEDLVAATDANFVGWEALHKKALAAPKYGNDDLSVDRLVRAVSDHVASATRDQAERVGLDYYLVVNINNYANVSLGEVCAASPDGRLNGAPLANGNTPTAGNDRKGVTALVKSIAPLDASCHAGYTQNMKFSPAWFRKDRAKLEAVLDTYWAAGGTQAMITCVSRGDLEAALKEPQKYANLIVRVGGFSARFVELAPAVQADLINRTLY
jgi:pyruvate-formate lyase